MTFRGYIQNGKVILEQPVDLPDGTEVELRRARKTTRKRTKPKSVGKEPAGQGRAGRKRGGIPKAKSSLKKAPMAHERYEGLIGLLNGLPSDFSSQHDHYIHGVPKR